MILSVLGHSYHYEMENLCRVFFPLEKIKVIREESENADVITSVQTSGDDFIINVSSNLCGKSLQRSQRAFAESDRELIMAVMLFEILSEITGYRPEWGVLTGVRPSKLMNKLINELGEEKARDYFRSKLLVGENKTELAVRVAAAESKIMASSAPESFSLYVSVPFCPTRCSYCSFISHSVKAAQKLIPEYVEKLCLELKQLGEIARSLGLKLETVYYGGGTPTTFNAEQLSAVGKTIENAFDLSAVREYTVEAGRPDTIDRERLSALKSLGVSRISINPQTFSDDVLKNIGRAHTAQETVEAFNLAQSLGFDNINMDLIAGLPGDDAEGFARTLAITSSMKPQGVTVHTLSMKRSSAIVTEQGGVSGSVSEVSKMLETAENILSAEYHPYYMYRQSKCIGNMENVGWCKAGFEGLYNIFMMEECHTVFAAGAGAVTKLKEPQGDFIDRVFNFKYPFEYISRFDELTERKNRIKEFYSAYC